MAVVAVAAVAAPLRLILDGDRSSTAVNSGSDRGDGSSDGGPNP